MTDEKKPEEQLMKLWTDGAKATADAMQAFFDAATEAAGTTQTGASADAKASTDDDTADQAQANAQAQDWIATWSKTAADLSALQAQFLQGLVQDLPDATSSRLRFQTFSQLQRLATANWEEELRRLSEVPAAMSERLSQADPDRMGKLLQTMTTEYLADMEGLQSGGFKIDLDPIANAWTKVMVGKDDPKSQQLVQRFLDALSVKARFGSEYYADPDKTPVGQTPRSIVHQDGKISLYRYDRPDDAPATTGDPVLVVYSVINKTYILDLQPGFSFVEHLLAQGLDVYMVEWGDTEPGDRTTTLDSYIDPGLTGCLDVIREKTGAKKVSLFGHCIGGNLALMLAALHPDDISRVVTLTTPITAAEGGVVAVWTDKDLFPVDAIVDATGHMPAKLIRYTFMVLKPYYEVMKWKMFLEKLGDDDVMKLFYPVDRWANENVDIPGAVFKKFVDEVFHANRFSNSETRIHGERVDLANITCPVMNLTATRDWIVPPASAMNLGELVGSDDYRHVSIEGAHVTVMIDPRARPTWTEMSDFLAED